MKTTIELADDLVDRARRTQLGRRRRCAPSWNEDCVAFWTRTNGRSRSGCAMRA